MKIYLGTDHRGLELKDRLIGYLEENGYDIVDKGAFNYDETDDYPDFVKPVAEEVSNDPQNTRGIILGYTGQGEAIAANRHKGVRAAVYYGGSEKIVALSREHNDANILSLGAGFLSEDEALRAVEYWLSTEFSHEERHERRINKIDQ